MSQDRTTSTRTARSQSERDAPPVIGQERFISVAQAAEIASRNHDTIRRWIRHGDLRATKVGRDYRISEAALLNMLGQVDTIDEPPRAGGAFHLRWGPLTRFELRDGR